MSRSIISEGKTSTEAIEKGLKELKVTREMVDIKILENDNKRSFFNILSPRVIKVEIKVKDNQKDKEKIRQDNYLEISEPELKDICNRLKVFLEEFFQKIGAKNIRSEVTSNEKDIKISINGENLNYLIGYRGEVLNSIQTIISAIANRNVEKRFRVLVDICEYRKKREKTLENLAEKMEREVVKNKKAVTLEPMYAYERKVIHNKLQNSNKVKTYSIGEEPYRKIVITLK